MDTPLCIDSPDPHILKEMLPLVKKLGILNSVSGEGEKCDILYPLLAENPDWDLVVLTCDNSGIPSGAGKKAKIAFSLIEKATQYGIAPERIYVDPLVMSLAR